MAEPSTPTPRLSGDDILGELVRNMEQGQFKVGRSVLVPYLYRVYLHADDFEDLRGIIGYLSAEAKRELAEQLAALNRPRRPGLLRRFASVQQPATEYKTLAPDFQVEFHPDWESKLQRGEIEIYSELGQAQGAEFGVGSATRRISRAVTLPDSPAATVSSPPSPIFARLTYSDDQGAHTFDVTKDTVVIGRGGKSYWVDVQLATLPDVSREHCRLRRDSATGQFFLKDVSQFGTTVNGQAVPSSLAIVDAREQDNNIEVPLPPRARIGLADVLILDFEVLSTS